jgi:hypothetical protein
MAERNVKLAVAIARDGRKKYLIAADAEVAPSALSDYVAGRAPLGPKVAARLAAALGVEPADIMPSEVSA